MPVSVLYPGADVEAFRPDLPTDDLRARHGLGDRPIVVCVSRLVARKGQDVLIRGMERVRRRVPDATLVIVGGGPYEGRLRALASEAPTGSVVFAGQVVGGRSSPLLRPRRRVRDAVPHAPRRARGRGMGQRVHRGGRLREASGGRAIPAARARRSSTARPGCSSTAPTWTMVADAVADLLADPARAQAMGYAGLARVVREHTWPAIARTPRGLAAGGGELTPVLDPCR